MRSELISKVATTFVFIYCFEEFPQSLPASIFRRVFFGEATIYCCSPVLCLFHACALHWLQMMAKENQAVTADLTRLGAEKEDGRRALGDAFHKAATAEQVCSQTT